MVEQAGLLVDVGKFLNRFPHRMAEIEVKIIGAAPFELVGEDPLALVQAVDEPGRHLAREVVALARVFRQRPAEERLGIAVVVAVGGVEIVDPVGIGAVDQLARPLEVDLLRVGGNARQAHRPEAQQGDSVVRSAVCACLHMAAPFLR